MSDARRKDEIRRLRAQAEALEARLVLLSHIKGVERPSSSVESFDFGCPNGKRVSVATLYKDLARRHRRLRLSAEEENARLRSMVERHRRTLASVRRILSRETRHVSAARQATLLELQQEKSGSNEEYGIETISNDDLNVLESILFDTHDPTMDVLVHGFAFDVVKPRIRRISASRLQLQMVFVRELPHHFEAVASSLYTLLMQVKNGTVQIPRQQPNKECGVIATLRIPFDDRVEFSFSAVPRLMYVQGKPIVGIMLKDTAGAVCSQLANTTEGFMTQLKMTIEIEIDAGQLMDNQQNLNALVSILAQTTVDQLKEGLDVVEDMLPPRQITV